MIEEIYTRLSQGRTSDPAKDFSASRMYTLLESPFTLWCEYHAPREAADPEFNRYEQQRAKFMRQLRDGGAQPLPEGTVDVHDRSQEVCFRATLEAMEKGAPGIAGAMLWNLPKNMTGRAALLLRVDEGRSVFGPYHYQIALFKQALELKEHYALQCTFLNEILAEMQGWRSRYSRIYLKNGERQLDHFDWCHRLDAELERWRDIRDGRLEPETDRPPAAALAPWRRYANKVARERKDLVLLPGQNWDMRDLLRRAGLNNTDDIVAAGYPRIIEIAGTAAADIFGNALAYRHNKPVLRNAGLFPPRKGERNLYFDFEGSDSLCSPLTPHTYLIGVWDAEASRYAAFTARGPQEEEKIFREFLAYIGDPAKAVLYHWTESELHTFREISKRYPELAEPLKALLPSCVDLKALVQKSFYIPSPSFSLKAVAPAFGFNWRQKDVNAMDAMVYYWDWLAGDEAAIQKALVYNEDDCVAMLHIENVLRGQEPLPMPVV
jgi:uncharacterized protein